MPPDLLPQKSFFDLVRGAAAAASQTDLTALLRQVIETGIQISGARYGALGVIGEDGSLIEFLQVGMDSDVAEKIGRPPIGKGLLGTITRTTTAVRVDDISKHPDSTGWPEHHPPMRAFLGVPIHADNQIFGNLYLTEKEGGFSEEDQALVEGLAVIAGSAVNNSRMQRRIRRLALVEDRERIARDIHDSIIQNIFGVGLMLQAQSQKLKDPEIRDSMEEAVERLDATINELRRMIFDLNPPSWANRDFRTEVNRLVEEVTTASNITTSVTMGPSIAEVPSGLVDDALHLIRESVTNAVRHANADRIDVSADLTDDGLTLTVIDSGDGFDPEAPTSGNGLTNLKTRCERAGGETFVMSQPGVGTTVRLRLPI
jgi:two-component system, NarL family, sensor histidine kinase DevS